MKEIIIPPEELWPYYTENKRGLTSVPEIVAFNEEQEVEIAIASSGNVNDISLYIYVLINGEIIDEVEADNADECADIACHLYDYYLSDSDCMDETDQISEREEELDTAVSDFLSVVAEEKELTVKSDVFDDFKEFALEYLYRKHNIRIRRPMWLEDENGKEFFEEYPYEHMIFEGDGIPFS